MPTTYTLSYDFGQLLNTAAPVALSAYVQTNLDQLDGSPLIASGEIRLGGGQLSFVDKTGVGSVSLVGSDSTDLNVPAGSLQYQVVASYVAPGKGGGQRTWLSGWFTLTANSDLSGLATTGTPTAPDPGTPASLVDFTPSGTLTAGDVQAALVELDGEKIATTSREQPDGVAGLDAAGLLFESRIPDLSGLYAADETPGLSALRHGADPTGVADSLTPFESVIGALTDPTDVVGTNNTIAMRGGGRVVIEPGVYSLSGKVALPSRTHLSAHGVTIVATAVGAGFTTTPAAGQFSPSNIVIEGLTFDGAGIATTGLDLQNCNYSTYRDVIVHDCVGDGITLTGGQWNNFQNVSSRDNDGRGFHLQPWNPTDTRLPNVNNNAFLRCYAQSNTGGGIELSGGAGNSFVGSTFQFNGLATFGAKIGQADARSNVFTSCHFEANGTHVLVDATVSKPRGTTLVAPWFVDGTAVERFVVNAGDETRIIGANSVVGGNLVAKNGIVCPYEQVSTSGKSVYTGYQNIAAAAAMFCDEAGVAIAAGDEEVFRLQTGRRAWVDEYSAAPVAVNAGSGSPEGVVKSNPGGLYMNRAGGAGATFWVKESGTGKTGWVAK